MMEQPTINPKKIILLVAGVIVLGMALIGTIYYFATTAPVAVTIRDGVTADIYAAKTDKGTDYTGGILSSVSGSKTVRLHKNQAFVVATQETNDYKTTTKRFEVGSGKTSVEVLPSYTDSKLQSLADTEHATFVKVLTTALPKLGGLYNVAKGKVFSQGEWYGTALNYKGKDASMADTLHVILHREGDSWKVVTSPPEIALSTLKYPAIPREVIIGVNALR